jgi:two-component system, LytTR family, response regulator LytT
MNVLIIEDEDLAAKRLKKMLELEIPGIQVHGPIDTVKNAISHLSEHRDYDLIFLDIQLADGRSFSIFESVEINTPVIFTTAYDEFAIKAFDLNSIDYLLKPIQQLKLHNSIEKYRKLKGLFNNENQNILTDLLATFKHQSANSFQSRFLVSKGDTLLPVNITDIAYFQAEDKVVFIILNDNTRLILNYSLDVLEQKVDPKLFFRVNRQYLVSAPSIRKVHYYFNYKLKLELNPQTEGEVVVSKLKTADFKSWMNG